ncbi:hypothetical protein B0H63DRAFT_564994 [Podospora didyma]|uniref:Tyrosinase copper-binding domain-containing protein n=1 Tax=Podospora didyma TaxID=330526 RepID=A0AAE0K1D0_9PEZI|nr:hypothetical protein B0H63DRAFT_564994 [Podospora didyma]
MVPKSYLCVAAAAVASTVSGLNIPDWGSLAMDNGLALAGLNSIALVNSLTNTKGTCNLPTRTLSATQRKNFISAVNCLTTKPSILPSGVAPGSFSIFDDFTFVHLTQTNFVHMTGNFLTWPRYFIHVYEQELKKCGYGGNLPYWEWGLDAGDPRGTTNPMGVHGGGHFTIGGNPGGDPFVASNDPAFWLHHAQIDCLYWIWQLQDFANRQNVYGTRTLLNFDPSPDATVDDLLDVAPLATSAVKIKDVMNTVGGSPLCYVYI